ncbi:hypothetical protein Clacol_001336 [Clathrus columnatus]|uniref:WSC domain-containing protein n=1 Tax=Clathrus columnatus TaxID=1419009 RepID=A0AAV5A295_9AGAM|nr:hypothetical protein Clacol_001336 [Clathrus columnatus]
MTVVAFLIVAVFSQIVWTQQFPGAWGPAGWIIPDCGPSMRLHTLIRLSTPKRHASNSATKEAIVMQELNSAMNAVHCDNDIQNGATQQNAAGCDINCPGNKTETCGGSLRLTLFQNNVPPFVPLVDKTDEFFYLGSFNDAPPNVEPFTFTTAPAGIVPPTTDIDGCAAWCKATSGNTIGLKESGQLKPHHSILDMRQERNCAFRTLVKSVETKIL